MRIVTVSMAMLLVGAAAQADEPLRCGNWLVTTPISVEDLLHKCGEPAEKKVIAEDVRSGGKTGSSSRVVGTVTTEKWTYRPGAQSLPMVVTIVDGKVTKIEQER